MAFSLGYSCFQANGSPSLMRGLWRSNFRESLLKSKLQNNKCVTIKKKKQGGGVSKPLSTHHLQNQGGADPAHSLHLHKGPFIPREAGRISVDCLPSPSPDSLCYIPLSGSPSLGQYFWPPILIYSPNAMSALPRLWNMPPTLFLKSKKSLMHY